MIIQDVMTGVVKRYPEVKRRGYVDDMFIQQMKDACIIATHSCIVVRDCCVVFDFLRDQSKVDLNQYFLMFSNVRGTLSNDVHSRHDDSSVQLIS